MDVYTITQGRIGMGLTVCQKIVRRSGGSINAQSEGEHKGAHFTFTMEMQKPDQLLDR